MSSTSNSQNLLVNVFRPVYTYSAGSGFTPKLVLSNVDILSAGALQTGQFQLGDSNSNVFLGSNAGTGSNNSNNVGIGVGAMQSKSDSTGTVAIGTNGLTGGSGAIDTVAIGNEVTGGGRSNVILGARSGTLGSNMILLGPGLATLGDDVSGKLYIGSGSLSNSLVYGDFNSRYVGINTVTPSTNLDVSGDASISRWLSVGYDPYQAPRGAVDANGYMYASLGFQAQGGSAVYPAFTFIDDSGTGIYKEGTGASGRFAVTSQGTKRMDISGDTLYIYANLRATGSVNIGAVDTSAFSFGDGFVRDNATTPQTDVSKAGIRTTTMDVSSLLQTSNGMIRVGPSSAPTVDISGSSIRAAQLYGTNFVVTPFVHDGAAGTFDLSSGNLRLNNVVRVSGTNGAIRIGSNAISSTIDISGTNIRADGTIQGVTVTTSAGYVYAPAHSFATDLCLGLYRVGTNALGFASAGIQRMCISGGNVGIGKAAPVTALEVVGDVSATTYNGPGGTAGAPHYTFSDDRTTGFFFPSANQIGFAAGGTERMRISNANIGIGTTAPTTALEISGGTITITSAANGPITIGNGTINVSGTTVVSATGVLSNAATTSNSIGGVVLSNTDISLTGRILGAVNTSNQIGGVTLSNGTLATSNFRNALSGWTVDISTDISLSSTGRFLGPATTSNRIGGVTLSNGTLATSNFRNALSGWTVDISTDISLSSTARMFTSSTVSNQIGGATLSNGVVAATTFRNALSGWTIDISGGNISNSGTLTTATLRTGDGSVSAPSQSFSNETGLGLYRVGAGQLGFATGGVARMTISNSNVGIGIAPSTNAALDISASGDTVLRITSADANPIGSVPRLEIKRGGGVFGAGTATDWQIANYDNSLYVSSKANNAATDQFRVTGGTTGQILALVNTGAVATPFYSFDIDTGTGMYLEAGSRLGFATTGVQRMIISNANVGIGTSVPNSILDVSAQNATIRIADQRAAGIPSLEFIRGLSPTFGGDANTDWRIRNAVGGNLTFTRADNTGVAGQNGDAVTMTYDGKVGIGRTDPSGILDISAGGFFARVFGGAFVVSSNNFVANPGAPPGLRLTVDSGDSYIQWGSNTNAAGFGTTNLRFTDIFGATERMRITSNGRVGIATSAPEVPVDVCGIIQAKSVGSTNDSRVYLEPRGFGSTPLVGDTTVGQVVFQTPGPYYATMKASISNGGYTDGVDLRFTTDQASGNNTQVDRMTIRSFTGFVGIGTTNPTQMLDVRTSETSNAAISMNTWPRTTASTTYFLKYNGTRTGEALTFDVETSIDTNLMSAGANNGSWFAVKKTGRWAITFVTSGSATTNWTMAIDASSSFTQSNIDAASNTILASFGSTNAIGTGSCTFIGVLPSNDNIYYKAKVNSGLSPTTRQTRLSITFLGEAPAVANYPF